MNTYDRLFGSGPRGFAVCLALFAMAWRLEARLGWPAITDNKVLPWVAFTASLITAAGLAAWSFRSLPVAARGVVLATSGPYRYVRHPLYASLLSCFNLGLAALLNDWIYFLWVAALHGVWQWVIRREEQLMCQAFPEQYPDYCRTTGRFFPRIPSLSWGPRATKRSHP